MRIALASVFVPDPKTALKFYTEVLGFLPKNAIEEINWYTVVSPDAPDGTELLLEPNGNPAASAFQQAIHEQGIAATAFQVDDLDAEYTRLTGLGVQFTVPPTDAGMVKMAVFDDTCGNLIQIFQMVA